MKKYPAKITKQCYECGKLSEEIRYYWESAYADAFSTHSMLHGQTFDLLTGRQGVYGSDSLRKYYSTYKNAIEDLKRAKFLLECALKSDFDIKEQEDV